MNNKIKYTVIGAGHGGKAMAAHLALMGFPVTLYNRTAANIAVIERRGGIELESFDGGPHGFGPLAVSPRTSVRQSSRRRSSWSCCPRLPTPRLPGWRRPIYAMGRS